MEHNGHGISARNANIAMAAITLVISILLIIATYRATTGYSNMRVTTDHYIEWQEHASDLQVGSDILTEQVRCFAETGKRAYLDGAASACSAASSSTSTATIIPARICSSRPISAC